MGAVLDTQTWQQEFGPSAPHGHAFLFVQTPHPLELWSYITKQCLDIREVDSGP